MLPAKYDTQTITKFEMVMELVAFSTTDRLKTIRLIIAKMINALMTIIANKRFFIATQKD